LLGGKYEREDRFEIDAEPGEEGATPQLLLNSDQWAEFNCPRHAVIFASSAGPSHWTFARRTVAPSDRTLSL
jgi:hypothetical protein